MHRHSRDRGRAMIFFAGCPRLDSCYRIGAMQRRSCGAGNLFFRFIVRDMSPFIKIVGTQSKLLQVPNLRKNSRSLWRSKANTFDPETGGHGKKKLFIINPGRIKSHGTAPLWCWGLFPYAVVLWTARPSWDNEQFFLQNGQNGQRAID